MNAPPLDFNRESWELHPMLELPDQFPPAVMFAIRDSDLRPQFDRALQKIVEQQKHHKVIPPPESVAPEMLRQAMLSAAWDSLFKDVPGDKVGLLFRNEGGQGNDDDQEEQGPIHAVFIKSNEPDGKKWLLTRASQFEGRVVCWCVPFEVRKGDQTEVQLTEENMTVLEMP